MAYKFSKSEMYYDDYSWTTYGNDDPKIAGTPDNTQFNRNEGYEVLYIINKMSYSSLENCIKAEKLIHDDLPSTKYTQAELIKWLKEKM